VGGVLGQDGGEERQELRVGGEVLRGDGEGGRGAYCELGRWGVGGEEREEVLCWVEGVFVDELRHALAGVEVCWAGGGDVRFEGSLVESSIWLVNLGDEGLGFLSLDATSALLAQRYLKAYRTRV
jgi:hypothetical protein